MKRANFPHRRDARRRGALSRLRAGLVFETTRLDDAIKHRASQKHAKEQTKVDAGETVQTVEARLTRLRVCIAETEARLER